MDELLSIADSYSDPVPKIRTRITNPLLQTKPNAVADAAKDPGVSVPPYNAHATIRRNLPFHLLNLIIIIIIILIPCIVRQ